MKNYAEQLEKIQSDLEILKNQNLQKFAIGGWLPKQFVKKFLDYGDTAFNSFIKANHIETKDFGRRLFVKESSLSDFLNKKLSH